MGKNYINILPKKNKPRYMIVWYSPSGVRTITSKTYQNEKTARSTAERAMDDVNALYPVGKRPYFKVMLDTEKNRSGAFENGVSVKYA